MVNNKSFLLTCKFIGNSDEYYEKDSFYILEITKNGSDISFKPSRTSRYSYYKLEGFLKEWEF